MTEIVNCISCGRDTKSKTKLCYRCREHDIDSINDTKDRPLNPLGNDQHYHDTDILVKGIYDVIDPKSVEK